MKTTVSVFFIVFFSIITFSQNLSSILTTPPAPIFSDGERQAELARRRTAVFAKMAPDSALILWSAEPRNYAGDVEFYYRQENNLYYLSSLKQKGAILVLLKNGTKNQEVLFLPPRDQANETWNGKMYSQLDAQRISGVKTILNSDEFLNFDKALRGQKAFVSNGIQANLNIKKLYLLLPASEFDAEGMAEFKREFEFADGLKKSKKSAEIKLPSVEDGRGIFAELRLVKSPYEIKMLQHAIDISVEAHSRAMANVGRLNWEYEVQAEVEHTFRRRNADYWGYPSIVGCGANATTLHYEESQSPVNKGDLLLMDVGAEYEHYSADVTRTFPVNGKFSKEQAEIYQIVYDAQEAAAKTIKPGSSFFEAEMAASKAVEDGLFRLGLITTKGSNQHRIWFMHGWGHWLGMNVHDVGGFEKFKPGMVTTNEPGIYIRPDALDYIDDKAFVAKIKPAFEKYKNIGVRIEDDMLVTETGVEWMTKKLPRKIEDVENFMRTAKVEN